MARRSARLAGQPAIELALPRWRCQRKASPNVAMASAPLVKRRRRWRSLAAAARCLGDKVVVITGCDGSCNGCCSGGSDGCSPWCMDMTGTLSDEEVNHGCEKAAGGHSSLEAAGGDDHNSEEVDRSNQEAGGGHSEEEVDHSSHAGEVSHSSDVEEVAGGHSEEAAGHGEVNRSNDAEEAAGGHSEEGSGLGEVDRSSDADEAAGGHGEEDDEEVRTIWYDDDVVDPLDYREALLSPSEVSNETDYYISD